MTVNRLTSAEDVKRRLLKKLQNGQGLLVDIEIEVSELQKQGHYTQAFLTQWMAVEQIAIHIIRTSQVCNWCEDAFKSLTHNLKDIGFSDESFEEKIYEPLFSKYLASRSSFEKINADQVYKCLKKIVPEVDEFKLKQLLADKLSKELAVQRTGSVQKTVRKQRNEIIHKNGRISEADYQGNQPFFDYFFQVIREFRD
ncbi:hypothetical protein [Pseudoalteromonas sp. T1lg76]|uniref:hypothetical protein n=1 Tax=Pseudoalteromonas sp. T1lg76 TaxID=2077103 RepID=UPI000CF6F3A3|nr:hypothetical protein [Pseudoalteromonas sp. T1lg76]